MLTQNVIERSIAVSELSCVQRKKTQTNTIQSAATARTVAMNGWMDGWPTVGRTNE